MHKKCLFCLAVLALSGCAGPRELQDGNNLTGTDRMKPSPCACMPVDYDAPGFEWANGENPHA